MRHVAGFLEGPHRDPRNRVGDTCSPAWKGLPRDGALIVVARAAWPMFLQGPKHRVEAIY